MRKNLGLKVFISLFALATLAFAQIPILVSPSPANDASWQYCSTLTFKASSTDPNPNFYLSVSGTLVDKWLMTKTKVGSTYYGTLSFTGDLVEEFVNDGYYQWRVCNSLNECTGYRKITKTSPAKLSILSPSYDKTISSTELFSWTAVTGANAYAAEVAPGIDLDGYNPGTNILYRDVYIFSLPKVTQFSMTQDYLDLLYNSGNKHHKWYITPICNTNPSASQIHTILGKAYYASSWFHTP